MLRNTLLFIQLGLFLPTLPSFQGLAGDTRALFRREYTVNLTAQPLGLYSWGEGWRRPLWSAWPAAWVSTRGKASSPAGSSQGPLASALWQLPQSRLLLGWLPPSQTLLLESFFFLMTPGGYLYHWFSSSPEDAHTSDPLPEESAVPSESPLCICSPGLL